MVRVLKYKLEPKDRQNVRVPLGSVPLSVHEQFSEIVLYVSAPKTMHLENIQVTGVLTGAEVPDDAGTYAGTLMLNGGSFVKHFYVSPTLISVEDSQ